LCQRGDIVVASKTDYLMFSDDDGTSYADISFADADLVCMCNIFDNGNILIGTKKNELWFSSDNLQTITQKYLKDTDGNNYVFHTPVNSDYPGIYFNRLMIDKPMYINDQEIFVFGNYIYTGLVLDCNGASPVLIYYSADKGETLKVAYKFGYGAGSYRDNGTATGSYDDGNLLGDPGNPIFTLHVHGVVFDSSTNEFYCYTGDPNIDCWMKGEYDFETDIWTWERILDSPGYFYRAGGVLFTSAKVFIASDSYTELPAYEGVWGALKENLLTYTDFTQVISINRNTFPMISTNKIFVVGHWNNDNGITFTVDGGVTWNNLDKIPEITENGAYVTPVVFSGIYDDDTIIVMPWDYIREHYKDKESYKIKLRNSIYD